MKTRSCSPRGSRTLYTNRLDRGCHSRPQKAEGEGTATEDCGEKARLGSSGSLPFQLEFSPSAHSFLEEGHRLVIAKSLASTSLPDSHGEHLTAAHPGASCARARPHHGRLTRPNLNSPFTPEAGWRCTSSHQGFCKWRCPRAEQECLSVSEPLLGLQRSR